MKSIGGAMTVILHQDYSCAPEGHTTQRFKAGDVMEGKAAAMALADGAGFNPVEETKVLPVMETKKGRHK
tara:strand:- start:88 stop:297 length:210 start_codon:yes stop_codon:yes gene_type:complete